MNKLIFALLILSLSFSSQAAEKTIGAGAMVGTMSSVNAKYWINKRDAIDMGVGVAGYPGISMYMDYLFNLGPIFAKNPKFWRETSAYLGGGAGVGFWSNDNECGRWRCAKQTQSSQTGIFMRALFGMEWMPSSTQFGVFGEGGGTILVSPATGFGFDASIGGRYYF